MKNGSSEKAESTKVFQEFRKVSEIQQKQETNNDWHLS